MRSSRACGSAVARRQRRPSIAELENTAELRSQMQPPPAIDLLSELFALTSFERQLLLLSAGVEMDSRLAESLREAQGTPADVRELRTGDGAFR